MGRMLLPPANRGHFCQGDDANGHAGLVAGLVWACGGEELGDVRAIDVARYVPLEGRVLTGYRGSPNQTWRRFRIHIHRAAYPATGMLQVAGGVRVYAMRKRYGADRTRWVWEPDL